MNNKFRIIVMCLQILCMLSGYAQTLMHYATNSLGEMPVILFPIKDGISHFEYSDETELSAEDILDRVEESVIRLSEKPGYSLELSRSGRKSLSYKVEMDFGSDPLALYPVWVFNRSATKVKCQLNVYAKDSTYKFTLTNFETNRNTIRGNAKNDGDPNIIHWQRVNSLLTERNEDVGNGSSRRDRYDAFDYNCRIVYECSLYTYERNMLENLICVFANVCKADWDSSELPTLAQQWKFRWDINELGNSNLFDDFNERFYASDEDISSGFANKMLPKIFVTSGRQSYELAGKNEIVKNIIIDGLGYVTSNESEADYLIYYSVDTSGRDKAVLTIKDRNGNLIEERKKGSSESDSENREVAESLYQKSVKSIFGKK